MDFRFIAHVVYSFADSSRDRFLHSRGLAIEISIITKSGSHAVVAWYTLSWLPLLDYMRVICSALLFKSQAGNQINLINFCNWKLLSKRDTYSSAVWFLYISINFLLGCEL